MGAKAAWPGCRCASPVHGTRASMVAPNAVHGANSPSVSTNGRRRYGPPRVSRRTPPVGESLRTAAASVTHRTAARKARGQAGGRAGPHARHGDAQGDRIEYRRQKAIRGNGVPMSIPVHPDLAEVQAALPSDRPYPAMAYGKPSSPDRL